MEEEYYRNLLAEKGLKITTARAMVLMILDQASEPMTVDEIYLDIKNKEPSVNLSTVYRTVDTLLKNAMVIKTILMDDNRSRYEYNRMEHKHHLICTGCNRMISIPDCPVDEYAESLRRKTGFELTGHKLVFYGICSDCKK